MKRRGIILKVGILDVGTIFPMAKKHNALLIVPLVVHSKEIDIVERQINTASAMVALTTELREVSHVHTDYRIYHFFLSTEKGS